LQIPLERREWEVAADYDRLASIRKHPPIRLCTDIPTDPIFVGRVHRLSVLASKHEDEFEVRRAHRFEVLVESDGGRSRIGIRDRDIRVGAVILIR
jgi:hypothetical protein